MICDLFKGEAACKVCGDCPLRLLRLFDCNEEGRLKVIEFFRIHAVSFVKNKVKSELVLFLIFHKDLYSFVSYLFLNFSIFHLFF